MAPVCLREPQLVILFLGQVRRPVAHHCYYKRRVFPARVHLLFATLLAQFSPYPCVYTSIQPLLLIFTFIACHHLDTVRSEFSLSRHLRLWKPHSCSQLSVRYSRTGNWRVLVMGPTSLHCSGNSTPFRTLFNPDRT